MPQRFLEDNSPQVSAEARDNFVIDGLRPAGELLSGQLLAAITTDRDSARRLCRLCDEPLCTTDAGCPVDHAAS